MLVPAALYTIFCPCAHVLKLSNQHHISRCAGESFNETNADSRQWWGWDGDREPRRYLSQTFHLCFPLLEFILLLLPCSSAPIALTAILTGNSLVFLSHSVCLVSFLCMVIVFQLLSNEQHLCRKVLPSLEDSFQKFYRVADICYLKYFSVSHCSLWLLILWRFNLM